MCHLDLNLMAPQQFFMRGNMVKVIILLKNKTYIVKSVSCHPTNLYPVIEFIRPEVIDWINDNPSWMIKNQAKKVAVNYENDIAIYEEIV